MADISGGEVVARALKAEGVEFLIGLPSPEIDPLFAQLENYGIRLVTMRHEAAAVHMAEGLYKTTGRVAAVLGNPGPGSANLVPGVVNARHEGVPVLVLTSQHRLEVVYPSRPSTYQGQDQLPMFSPVVKWGGPVLEWSRIVDVLQQAFREMWSGRPGPVHVELPGPVLYEQHDEALAEVRPPSAYRPPQPQASEAQLAEAVALLSAAERPLVVAGTGVDRAGAGDALIEIVERLGCPVVTTMAGRGSVSGAHPNYLFNNGPAGDLARREADVVLVAGSRLGNLDLPYDKYWGDPVRQRIIQIDIEPRDIGVTRPLTLGIVADLGDALPGIARLLREQNASPRDGGDLARYRAADADWREVLMQPVTDWTGPGIHPATVMASVGQVFGPDAIYVVDGGNTLLWAHCNLPSTRPRSYHTILELGMLGTGIPQAIGAKLGAPDRDVVCVTGDGAAGFHGMELQSAAREGLDLTVVVFAEGSWTMQEPNELAVYGRTYGTAQGDVRWDVWAQGLGCHGEFAERSEDVEPAIKRAKAANGPAVVCVRTDHAANLALPPKLGARFAEVYTGPTAEA